RGGALTAFAGSYEHYCEQRELAERQAWERYEAQQRREAAARRAAEQRARTASKVARTPGAILFVSHDRCFVEKLAEDRIDLGYPRSPRWIGCRT
ncbi:MAG TPA: hypothetical protein VF756_28705, partial [Thermoanaerobaculia bacterium]